MTDAPRINVGDYVLATKYDDGDPGDHWALGFYAGTTHDGSRHLVTDANGETIRAGGFRRVARIRKDAGAWMLNTAARALEASPPGTVSLWGMLTPKAFDVGNEDD